MTTLACADPACGCKITYAPKKKPSGLTFHYYRCADGKRIHRGRGGPQVNVREEGILDQLGAAVDAVSHPHRGHRVLHRRRLERDTPRSDGSEA